MSFAQIMHNSEIMPRKQGYAMIASRGVIDFSVGIRYHRENGPASIYPSGYVEWHQRGKCHRTNGPAVIWHNGCKEYWIHGDRLSVEEFFATYGVL